MKHRLREKYLSLLQWLCRRELKRIADHYPASRDELIKWHDYMAIECVNKKSKGQDRLLGICVQTAEQLENPASKT